MNGTHTLKSSIPKPRLKKDKKGIEQGLQQGIQQGIEQGALNAKREMAKGLRDDGVPLQIIMKRSGLPKTKSSRCNFENLYIF